MTPEHGDHEHPGDRFTFTTWKFLEGAAQSALGNASEARGAWDKSLEYWIGFTASARALSGEDTTLEQFLKAEESVSARFTGHNLAMCGHYYLELEMPERAKTCLEEAERIYPGRGEQERIAHLAESDAAGALQLGEELLAQRRDMRSEICGP
jgi:tetratricopeptide (TPR) repeat protein